MTVEIRFRGPIANRMASPVYEVDLSISEDLRNLLERLISTHPEIAELWKTPEEVDREALILCNEADIALFDGLDTQVQSGDHIIVLPIVHGG
ncbi:hypothetical protein EU538_08370 [Candidatus Thorarchaeota archaeon]|nr:MAG: hypothetical protein EU538_08370 [Candidatus Thorarchaeota archaeon]